MQALEAEIGGALLERTTGGVRPTDAGNALASSLPSVPAEYSAADARRALRDDYCVFSRSVAFFTIRISIPGFSVTTTQMF